MSEPQSGAWVEHGAGLFEHVLHRLAHRELTPSGDLEEREAVGTGARDVDPRVVGIAGEQSAGGRESRFGLLLGRGGVDVGQPQGVAEAQRVGQTNPLGKVALVDEVLRGRQFRLRGVVLVGVEGRDGLGQLLEQVGVDALLAPGAASV